MHGPLFVSVCMKDHLAFIRCKAAFVQINFDYRVGDKDKRFQCASFSGDSGYGRRHF
jgi:hypothetical protein